VWEGDPERTVVKANNFFFQFVNKNIRQLKITTGRDGYSYSEGTVFVCMYVILRLYSLYWFEINSMHATQTDLLTAEWRMLFFDIIITTMRMESK
jgi:hypothetical protein